MRRAHTRPIWLCILGLCAFLLNSAAVGSGAVIDDIAAPAPSMSLGEAQWTIDQFARGRLADACTGEGRLQLRQAVRVFADHEVSEGRFWPSFAADQEFPPSNTELAVLGALMANVLEADDFGAALTQEARLHRDGPARGLAEADLNSALATACPQVIDFLGAVARGEFEARILDQWIASHANAEEGLEAWRMHDYALHRLAALEERAYALRADIESLLTRSTRPH